MHSVQCSGTTKAGKRCQCTTNNDNGYCGHHQSQFSGIQRAPGAQPVQPVSKAGYIYIYGLEPGRGNVHLYSSKNEKFEAFKVRNEYESGWGFVKRLFGKESSILVKIGYTSSTPTKRLQQWYQQCGHTIHLIDPKKSESFDYNTHGWPSSSAYDAEQSIHQILRQQYGQGDLKCGGCKPGKLAVHTEWFMIPRHRLKKVYKVIEREIDR